MKGIVLSATDSLDFANEIYQIMGNATLFDWRMATGTPFGTTAYTQDYTNVPSDFAALHRAHVQDDSATSNILWPLTVFESLPAATVPYRRPEQISVENTKFRLLPVPNVTRSGSGQWVVTFTYWKRPKVFTATSDTFEFDDIWFNTFCKGFTARTASFVDDARAGQWLGRDLNGRFAGTGMWGEFAAQLNNMVEQESQASGSTVYAPMESIFKG